MAKQSMDSTLGRLRRIAPSPLGSTKDRPSLRLKPLPGLLKLGKERMDEEQTPPLPKLRPVPAGSRKRILDFDIERRPLNYLGGDFTSGEVTAIAACWADQEEGKCWALPLVTSEAMLRGFRELWDEADVVTGHNIVKFDLPHINGAMLEHGLPPLDEKVVSDTYLHLVKRGDLSGSQANLAEMLGVPEAKYAMSAPKWRDANRLGSEGVELTRKRVIDDVIQHKALRAKLIELKALKPPRVWKP